MRPDGHVAWRCSQPQTAPQHPQQGLKVSELKVLNPKDFKSTAAKPENLQPMPMGAADEGPYHAALLAAFRQLLYTSEPFDNCSV